MSEKGVMMSDNFEEFVEELYRDTEFLDYANSLAFMAGYIGGDDIGEFQADLAMVLFRHRKKAKSHFQVWQLRDATDVCFRGKCDRRIETSRRRGYKGMYCSKVCSKISNHGYYIARATEWLEYYDSGGDAGENEPLRVRANLKESKALLEQYQKEYDEMIEKENDKE